MHSTIDSSSEDELSASAGTEGVPSGIWAAEKWTFRRSIGFDFGGRRPFAILISYNQENALPDCDAKRKFGPFTVALKGFSVCYDGLVEDHPLCG